MTIDRSIAELENELDRYCANLRGSKMPKIELSGLYDLYPPTEGIECKYFWPNDYPFVNSAGVYFIFDSDLQILYIGKASMSSWLGARLSTYFRKGPNGECILKHADYWKGAPQFVAVIPMVQDFKWEAPALEEYLIMRFNPIDNKAGAAH